MSNLQELKIINPGQQRVDLISALEWVIAENQLPPDYQLGVKAYATLSHGLSQDRREGWVRAGDLRNEVGKFRRGIPDQVDWSSWSTAISSVFVNEDLKPTLFIPVMDLEIDATEDPEQDLRIASYHLLSIGFSGLFLRSGDVGSGSYFFVADGVRDYDTYFKDFFGLMLVAMIDWQTKGEKARANRHLALELGERVIETNKTEAKVVAQEILQKFPSIQGGQRRLGLEIDPRWVAHRFLEEKTYLRFTPGKGYEDKPLVVADLY